MGDVGAVRAVDAALAPDAGSLAARWRSAWLRFLVAGAALVAVTLLLPTGPLRDTLYMVVSLGSVAAVVVGVRLNRPSRTLPWYLMAAGGLAWASADLMWLYFAAHDVEPFPSVADVLYLVAYPLLGLALFQLARGRERRSEASAVLDALIVSVVVALVLWVLVVAPAWATADVTVLGKAIATAYPVGDVVLIVQLVYLRSSPRVRSTSLRLLTAAFVVTLVSDVLFQAISVIPALEIAEPTLDLGWLSMYLLWGAAALHPSMAQVTDGRTLPSSAFTTGRVLVLGSAFLVLPLLDLGVGWAGLPASPMAQNIAHLTLVVLVVIRMIDLVGRLSGQADRLAVLADTDFLTGLDNRRRFLDRLTEVVEPSADGDPVRPHAVLLVGLERFNDINETLGHKIGDDLLRSTAVGLRTVVGTAPALARIGGDVFGVLVGPVTDQDAVMALAERIRSLVRSPMLVSGLSITVDGGVGVVFTPQDGWDAEELLARADLTLSAARAATEGVLRFAPEMEDLGAASLLMAELRDAMDSGELVVHFQPQVEIETGHVLGAEALVRWQHPEHGLIPPGVFVPAAERTGLIRLLTLVVLDRAVGQCAVWAGEGRDLTVSVNLSVRNLLDPRLVDDVCDILAKHGVPAARLELEITETMAMVDPVRSAHALGELARLGVVLSIDDYGTGYGSLAYLQRLPVRRLKIDRSFVSNVLEDPASAAIVRSTIDLAHHLGLSVVAEGVEDDETLLALRDMHCYAAQGFGLGRPVGASSIQALFDAIEARVPDLVQRPPVEVPRPWIR